MAVAFVIIEKEDERFIAHVTSHVTEETFRQAIKQIRHYVRKKKYRPYIVVDLTYAPVWNDDSVAGMIRLVEVTHECGSQLILTGVDQSCHAVLTRIGVAQNATVQAESVAPRTKKSRKQKDAVAGKNGRTASQPVLPADPPAPAAMDPTIAEQTVLPVRESFDPVQNDSNPVPAAERTNGQSATDGNGTLSSDNGSAGHGLHRNGQRPVAMPAAVATPQPVAFDSAADLVVLHEDVETEPTDWGSIAWLARADCSVAQQTAVARVTVKPGHLWPFHRHPGSESVLHVLSGRGTNFVGEQTAPTRPGDLICVPVGQVYAVLNEALVDLEMIVSWSPPGDPATHSEDMTNVEPWKSLTLAHAIPNVRLESGETALFASISDSAYENTEQLHKRLLAILNAEQVTLLIVDLAGTTFLSRNATTALKSLADELSYDERQLVVCGANDELREFLAGAGLTTFANREEAHGAVI